MRKRILLVEDNATQRGLARNFIEQAGYECETAENNRLGWNLLSGSQHFDAIIADYSTPELDGLQLLFRVRGPGNHPQTIPFALMSSETQTRAEDGRQPESLPKLCEHLRAEFVLKPFYEFGELIGRLLGPPGPKVP